MFRGGAGAYGNAAITGGTIDGSSLDNGSGIPVILAKSFVPSSGAADTNENILGTVTVPANALGANGGIRITATFTFTNNANNKTFRIRYSAIGGTAHFTLIQTTQTNLVVYLYIGNRNATNSQISTTSYVNNGALVVTPTASAVDTTAATTIVLTGQKATAGDTVTLESYIAELFSTGA